ncbi:MAG: hypothetical protein EOO31_04420 [Comamonadaceae bacterium]|nr:MAG: hypothetical protein EOO31_04420 [Comamonadaceae bacterium]
MKNTLCLLAIPLAIHFLVGAFAADESLAAAQREETEAMNSRDFAGRWACGDRTAVWLDDKTIECLKETP